MRFVDAAECAAFGLSPKAALRTSLRTSVEAVTAFVDGRPEAMFGVVPISALEGRGSVWFLGTDAVARCASTLILVGPDAIAALHRRFRRLENTVSTDNVRAIRMLRRWGFEMGSTEVNVGGVSFRPFWKVG
jgi:hypothetical protein